MDQLLTDFIQRTKAEPSLARDLLEATDWNLDSALLAYDSLNDTRAVQPQEFQYNPKDFEATGNSAHQQDQVSSPSGSDQVDHSSEDVRSTVGSLDASVDDNEAERRAIMVTKRRRTRHSRGLFFEGANEVMQKFTKVSVTKQRVSSKEQVTIDEKFFSHSFFYPDLSSEADELQVYIARDLMEVSHKKTLEQSGRLNWWTSTGRLPRLEPLATSGDGNCLLHAASLYMWGFHDHFLILRTALHRVLTAAVEKEGLKRRWKYQTQLRNDEAGGLTFSEEEWEFEWEEILRIATNKPRQQRTTDSLRRYSSLRVSYESLEEVHIFALAHTLCRPIVVISDSTVKDHQGQDLAPIYFGGIYLPLELSPNSCSKSPVVLAFDSSHFSALVARQSDGSGDKKQKGRGRVLRSADRKESVIPLVTPDGSLLPVQFIHDPKKNDGFRKWGKMQYELNEFPDEITGLLEAYLNVRWIQLKVTAAASPTRETTGNFPIQVPRVRFPAADMGQDRQPQYQKELIEKYLEHIRERYAEEKEKKARWQAETELEEKKRQQNKTVPCEGEGCEMFGRPATNNLCSVCYQKKLNKKDEDLKDGGGHQSDIATEGSGPKPETRDYDRQEEEDVANMHRRLVASTPSPLPPTYSEHVRHHPSDLEGSHYSRRSPRHASPDVSDMQEVRERAQKSPTRSSQLMGFNVSPRRGLHDGSTSNKTSPTHASVSSQHNQKLLATGSQVSAKQPAKQPMFPPKLTQVSPSHKTKESGWGDSVYSDQSVSPRDPSSPVKEQPRSMKPLPLPKRFSPPPEYEATPTSDFRTKRVSPPPNTEAPPSVPPKTRRVASPQPPEVNNLPPLAPKSRQVVSSSPEHKEPPPLIPKSKRFPSPTPRGETSNPSVKNTSASVQQKIGEVSPTKRQMSYPAAKSSVPSSSSGSRYTRDNIQPLHLDPMQQSSGGSHSRGAGRIKCRTPDCDFFGSSKTDGYCSSCAKNSLDGPTTLV